ncbi:glycoside hydrolase family 15 protein [Streptomyces pseudovenezuelae]|uniref:glycoside hydrolase family 15 protein n=1 Tax=Streptomyces pseudovenezuelae TaxID=67350 RepID=UPI002E800964|nr:glycoside hydrolase family 15 protein [Streptomyces pseudovenezuelae]WUA86906.1 glycoside hydrolase family 15 protein [Streptomyces pseudovenezuelae]
MRRYAAIEDHGLVGDLQTAALVSSEGTVDWFCAPRFDSPSVFAALLDHAKGGHFAVSVDSRRPPVQLYLQDTAVLVTRFLTESGVGEVIDFMPVERPERPADRHRLVRILRVTRGQVRFALECRPRFDYGRSAHEVVPGEDAVRFRGAGGQAVLQAVGPLHWDRDGDDVRGELVLKQDEFAAVVLTTGDSDEAPVAPVTQADVVELFERTRDFWHTWVRRSRYRGRWQDMVNRAAITLKLLTYAPTGAPVAAATMGLPEQIGGGRNWDYRYTWVRDGSLSVGALLGLGHVEEAQAFRRWLGDRLRAGRTVSGEPLQIMYRVDGDPELTEEVLDHFEGYRGSAPVRVGNGAADQLQLDIYGEASLALAQAAEDSGEIPPYDGWQALSGVLDWLVKAWDQPDEGIWETRGGRRDFTYSRLMCWAAFDRGVRMAREFARPADLAQWSTARDDILRQVMERGWSTKRRAFVQQYEDSTLDASLLLMPSVGFVSPTDPRWLSTLDAMEDELVSDSLVHRYDPAASPDGLRGSEGTFSLCSFLYVEALARSGRLGQARYAFDKMLTYANHAGLFAEEIGPTGEQLGNFPQAFTHLALITAALALDHEMDAVGS